MHTKVGAAGMEKAAGHIAFFVTGVSVSTYMMQLAEALAERHVHVDIFCDWQALCNVNSQRLHANPVIKQIRQHVHLQNCAWKKQCVLYLKKACAEIFSLEDVKYAALVGIEKTGLALAFAVAHFWKIPVIHWSLELYDMNHAFWAGSTACPEYWLAMERIARKSALATIIQDQDRGDALAAMTGQDTQRIYLPVTIGKKEVLQHGEFCLHDICHIPHDRKILLSFGRNQMPLDFIMRMAEALPEKWILVLHEFTMQKRKDMLHHPRLCISAEYLDESMLPALIASASVGLVHYRNMHSNERLTVRSSEKVARYLAAGIPILVHAGGNFSELFARYPAGLVYNTPEDVGMAIQYMEKHMQFFQNAAQHAGQEYLFENVGKDCTDFLYNLAYPGESCHSFRW